MDRAPKSIPKPGSLTSMLGGEINDPKLPKTKKS